MDQSSDEMDGTDEDPEEEIVQKKRRISSGKLRKACKRCDTIFRSGAQLKEHMAEVYNVCTN